MNALSKSDKDRMCKYVHALHTGCRTIELLVIKTKANKNMPLPKVGVTEKMALHW